FTAALTSSGYTITLAYCFISSTTGDLTFLFDIDFDRWATPSCPTRRSSDPVLSADVTTSGDQTYDGAVTLAGDRTLTGATVTFTKKVTNSNIHLTIYGVLDLFGATK